MIDDYERYQSLALYSLIGSSPSGLSIKKFDFSKSAFELNGTHGLYIKHASARLTPWNFGFRQTDYLVMTEIESKTKSLVIALVCGFEGLVVLSKSELLTLTNFYEIPDENCRVTVRTKHGGSWDISGNAGNLPRMKLKTAPWKDIKLN